MEYKLSLLCFWGDRGWGDIWLKNEGRKNIFYLVLTVIFNTAFYRSRAYNMLGRSEGTKWRFWVGTCCTWYTTAAAYLLQVFRSDPCGATLVRVPSCAAQFTCFVLFVDTATPGIRSHRLRLRLVTRFSMFSFPRMFFDYPLLHPPCSHMLVPLEHRPYKISVPFYLTSLQRTIGSNKS